MTRSNLSFSLFGVVFLFALTAMAQDWRGSVITDPAISTRCDKLLGKRQKKIVHKNQLKELMDRNERLKKNAPRERVKARKFLRQNQSHIRHELELTELKIVQLEEEIIRKGCPGINL